MSQQFDVEGRVEIVSMSSSAADGDQPLCGVCLGGFVQPRVLPCGHSFCSNCILQCIRHSIEAGSVLSCPMCKKHVGYYEDEDDVETFPRNFELEKLMGLYLGIRNRNREHVSGWDDWEGWDPLPADTQPPITPRVHEGGPDSDPEEAEQLRLAVQMSLQDCGPTVDAELQKEDEELAQAIHNSQIESNPSRAADGSNLPGVNLKLKNLHPDVTHEQVVQLFSRFGTISSSRVISMPRGRLKGYGFVCFGNPEAANQARLGMNGYVLCGWPIKVDLAQGGRNTAQGRRNAAQRGGTAAPAGDEEW